MHLKYLNFLSVVSKISSINYETKKLYLSQLFMNVSSADCWLESITTLHTNTKTANNRGVCNPFSSGLEDTTCLRETHVLENSLP